MISQGYYKYKSQKTFKGKKKKNVTKLMINSKN